jgi:hypothetical protein
MASRPAVHILPEFLSPYTVYDLKKLGTVHLKMNKP